MAKYKIVHYINQFFAGIGGEEKADYTPELREGVVGPGKGCLLYTSDAADEL